MVNPNYFAENYVYTRDPHAEVAVRKWPKYGYLQHALSVIAGRNPVGLVEDKPVVPRAALVAIRKSRHLLFTWLLCVYLILRCAFEPHREGMIQSEKEEKAKAVVGRIGFILRELDRHSPWLLPSTPTVTTQAARFVFPDGSESVIWSVPQGPNQVASYSPTIVAVDEAALQEHFRETYYTALPAVREGGQFIAVSTVRYDAFFNKVFCKLPAVKTITAHYKDHPDYVAAAKKAGGWEKWKKEEQKAWGEEDRGFWDREMEINEDATGGVPAFKPPFLKEHHVCSCELVPDPGRPIQRGWDFGFRHPACVWTQKAINGQWLILREHMGENVMLADFVRQVVRLSKEMAPWANMHTFEDFCDPSGVNKSDTGLTSVQVLREHSIFPRNIHKKAPKVPLKESVQLIQRNLTIVKIGGVLRPGTLIDPRCVIIIRGMNGAYASSEKHPEKFVGGSTAHLIDALRYVAAGAFRLGAIPKRKRVQKIQPFSGHRLHTVQGRA